MNPFLCVVMNFNLLFSVVSTLSFIIEFPVSTENRQDYFLFQGNDQYAHLFRENGELILHVSSSGGYTIYNASSEERTFRFSWSGFKIDGVKMNKQKSSGIMGHHAYENFTFLSPTVDILNLEGLIEPVYHQTAAVNYWYFLVMVLAVAAVFDTKPAIIDLIKKHMKYKEDIYTVIDQLPHNRQSIELNSTVV